MNQHISVVTALLNSIAYNGDDLRTTVVPEADFAPFDFSHLRDFPGRGEQARTPFQGHGQNASDPLSA
jgi:hypothetical protein